MLSQQAFLAAQKVIPGGVNSPVRAFRGVGGTPRFIARAEGAYIFDVDILIMSARSARRLLVMHIRGLSTRCSRRRRTA